MPQTYRLLLHTRGPALWPDHKSNAEVLETKATTLLDVWEATYQSNPTPPGGSIFKRDWWSQAHQRYDSTDPAWTRLTVARWLSFDTGMKDKETNDPTACVIADLLPDYRMLIRRVVVDRWTFDVLPDTIMRLTRQWNSDHKLRGVIIEDKVSGTSAYQTLTSATADPHIAGLVMPFLPMGDKIFRAKQASVWCQNGSILLPTPSDEVPWLLDFEDELFTFPGSIHDDQVDAFSQIILYCENYLSEGWHFRHAALQRVALATQS